MKIGLIIYGSIHSTSGGYIYDKQLVEYLARHGVEIQLFSQKKSPFAFIKNNFSKSLFKAIEAFSPDVLLQDEMNFISLFILNHKIKKKLNVCIISIVHALQANLINNALLKGLTEIIEKWYLKSVDGFIFNSMTLKQCIESRIGQIKKSLIAYPGKDRLQPHAMLNTMNLRLQNPVFMMIFIGNLFYNKGLHTLIKALAKIDDKPWRLAVVGSLLADIKYTRTISKMIQDLKLDKNITLYGVLDKEKLSQLLCHQHALIVPSYYESFGIVYLEAMGAGLPVIACNGGGSSEIVEDLKNGFLISPDDVGQLKERILQWIDNRDLLKNMSLSSLSSYKNFPTWDESMEKIHLFLRKECFCVSNHFRGSREN